LFFQFPDGRRRRPQWTISWTDRSRASFAERCIAFAIIEGVFFSGSFCAIFWLKKCGILPGLCFSNELISRDEGLHCDFACLLYSKLQNKLTKSRILEILTEAVEIEKEFIREALPVELIGMNSTAMSEYIEFCADRLLLALNIPRHYQSTNPFPWMERVLVSKGKQTSLRSVLANTCSPESHTITDPKRGGI